MEKVKHSLIRIERYDGEAACCGIEGDDPDELLAMLGDGLAHWLYENPRKWRQARRFLRRVFRDFCPDWLAYFLEGWPLRLVGVGVWFAALYGFAAAMKALGA